MQLPEIINLLLGSTAVASVYVAWKSRKAQVQITESHAMQEMQKAYDEFVKHHTAVVDDLRREVNEVKTELNTYKSRCRHCAQYNEVG